jgi:multiple sugar transport system ATP-binding protein
MGREGTLFCATFEPRTAIRPGDEVEVALDVERLHFFDPETEVALRKTE